MKIAGQCFRQFVEFPIIPFDPAVFGFIKDVSRSSSPAGCPCFATEDDAYRLWVNWPDVAEREWYANWSRFFITRRDGNGEHDPATREPILVFKTENLFDLVRHLLVHRYDSETRGYEINEAHATQWFRAIKAAGVRIILTNLTAPEIRSQHLLSETECNALLDIIEGMVLRFGDRLQVIADIE